MLSRAPAAAQPPRASPLLHFAAGWLAASVSAVLLSPLEVLKTRQQSSLRSLSAGMRVDQMLMGIVRAEGFVGLYRGLVPTLLGVGPTRAIFFGGYSFLKQGLESRGIGGAPEQHSSSMHLLAASLASMASVTITSPVWVVKTRLQLQSAAPASPSPQHYSGVWDAFRKIHASEGPGAFFRGLSASYLGVIETSLQFVLYGHLKSYIIAQRLQAMPPAAREGRSLAELHALAYSGASSFWTSALTKFVVAIITYPHEVLRTRMREVTVVAGQRETQRYRSVLQTASLVLREEGIKGLYGGMGVHLLRTVPNAAILLYVVEQVTGGQV